SDDATAPPGSASSSLTVSQLPQLVEEAQSAGLLADLEVVGQPRDLSPLVGLNLYRIGQEALTNVVKHTGTGTRTRVRLRYLPDTVELEITDDGRGRPMPRPRGGGLGLQGMRERVAAMRGTLTAEPRSSGGFIVRATVPDGAEARPTAADRSTADTLTEELT
ncbi:MAG: sensor histidine kinase, partial [Salana multivorans]|nr:sensor histidine kinase [Salana multivorans]